ncbi:uncharacterized protein MYCFIDRAFT_169072 [Pseudocercospora fijiensis CIRAD86]|uniref:Uncharacterized protein n=1 Tax=Pseudocercospora fijiensis (strain CIRAD86) TaxID=383855 RepID=N1Q5N3_PSEFD|nr:uncharacterized protein MYCFIDRAFT_169072 [Pseudocercospora fijiensis CIRAD86]EME87214.1 hypothetical protein MYCFIDRAFT_169072 [Pseudocercospora fijiensis CIRAD86]
MHSSLGSTLIADHDSPYHQPHAKFCQGLSELAGRRSFRAPASQANVSSEMPLSFCEVGWHGLIPNLPGLARQKMAIVANYYNGTKVIVASERRWCGSLIYIILMQSRLVSSPSNRGALRLSSACRCWAVARLAGRHRRLGDGGDCPKILNLRKLRKS